MELRLKAFAHWVRFFQIPPSDPWSEKKKRYTQKPCTPSPMRLFFYSLRKFAAQGKNWVIQQWGWFSGSVTYPKKKEKTLGSSNSKNKRRARRVSPAGKRAAEISRSPPGVFQDVSGPAIVEPHIKRRPPISANQLILNSGWQYVWSSWGRGTHTHTQSLSLFFSLIN